MLALPFIQTWIQFRDYLPAQRRNSNDPIPCSYNLYRMAMLDKGATFTAWTGCVKGAWVSTLSFHPPTKSHQVSCLCAEVLRLSSHAWKIFFEKQSRHVIFLCLILELVICPPQIAVETSTHLADHFAEDKIFCCDICNTRLINVRAHPNWCSEKFLTVSQFY